MTVAICINVSIYETNKLYQKIYIILTASKIWSKWEIILWLQKFSMIYFHIHSYKNNLISIANKCTIKISVVNL